MKRQRKPRGSRVWVPAELPSQPVDSVRGNAAARTSEVKEKAMWIPHKPAEPLPLPVRGANAKSNQGVWKPPEPAEPLPLPVLGAKAKSNRGVWVPPAPVVRPLMRPRLVFAFDATLSRSAAWKAAKRLTDVLLKTVPGELDVALAVHSGGELKTFTRFTSAAGELARQAAGVRCRAGGTRLLDILGRVIEEDGVRVVVYIGDMFEESPEEARRLADELGRRGTRIITLHDTSLEDHRDAKAVFDMLAERTGGAVLPFDISALEKLGELLEAVAVLAVGGTEMLDTKKATMPAATLLLEHLR